MRLPWEYYNQSQDTNLRHCVTGQELPFFHKRKGVLKIDQSVKCHDIGLVWELQAPPHRLLRAFNTRTFCMLNHSCWFVMSNRLLLAFTKFWSIKCKRMNIHRTMRNNRWSEHDAPMRMWLCKRVLSWPFPFGAVQGHSKTNNSN